MYQVAFPVSILDLRCSNEDCVTANEVVFYFSISYIILYLVSHDIQIPNKIIKNYRYTHVRTKFESLAKMMNELRHKKPNTMNL